MRRLAISVEGQTEEDFVKSSLAPWAERQGACLTPVVVTTSRLESGIKFKGGAISIDRLSKELRRLLMSFDAVTTLFDYYGFADRLPNEAPDQLLARLRQAVPVECEPRFLPYIQVYEFEALVLAASQGIAPYLRQQDAPSALAALEADIANAGGPEQVNDGPDTHPSARLTTLFERHSDQRQYRKRLHGIGAIGATDLSTIAAACPRFAAWLGALEALCR